MKGELVAELIVAKHTPLNANGAFIDLRGGEILFAYNRRLARHHEGVGAEIACVRSRDAGKSWSSPMPLLSTDAADARRDVSNVSLLRRTDGRLTLYHSVLHRADDLRLYWRVSGDEGLTWSVEMPCMPVRGFFSVSNDRVVRLASGRLIIPAAYHDSLRGEEHADATGARLFSAIDYCGTCCFFLSDDDGETWRLAPGTVTSDVAHSVAGLQEPGAVELRPGTLWGFARTDLGRHYEFFSFDDGLTWTQARPSRFSGPVSPLTIKRHPCGALLAVWNPVPNYISQDFDSPRFQRSRLVYAQSPDGGETWRPAIALEDTETGDYTHPALHFVGDAALIAYSATFGQAVNNGAIRIRRISNLFNCS